MSTTFDSAEISAPATGLSRLRAIPKRALVIGFGAVALALAGTGWIALPTTSVSTDDAYTKADSTIIAPKVHGLIAQVLVRDNARVKAGQPLIRIDDDDYQQALQAAQADVQSAQAALDQQVSQAGLAAANVRAANATVRASDAENVRAAADRKRFDALVATGDVSSRQAEQMRATAETASADVEKDRAAYCRQPAAAGRGQRRRAHSCLPRWPRRRAALLLAQQNLTHTVVRAPVDGVVGDRQAQIGEYVQPGTQLLTVVPMHTMYVVANFKETQTSRMLAGQKVRVSIDALPSARFHRRRGRKFRAGDSGSEFSLLPFEPATGNFTRIVQRVAGAHPS